jgi:hypothetical protein
VEIGKKEISEKFGDNSFGIWEEPQFTDSRAGERGCAVARLCLPRRSEVKADQTALN